MKKTIAVILISFLLIFTISCNNSSQADNGSQKADEQITTPGEFADTEPDEYVDPYATSDEGSSDQATENPSDEDTKNHNWSDYF